MKIHKEGYSTIFITFLVILVAAVWLHILLPHQKIIVFSLDGAFLILFTLIVYFFRSPKRVLNINHEYILSAADGKVVVIEEVVEPEYLHDRRTQVSVFMSPLNVHSNRYPCSGTIRYYKYHPGSYIVAWHPKSSEENERTTVVIENKRKQLILVRQIAGALARRIICNAKEGAAIKQGQELGFIKFGSRVDVLLPLNADIKVELGQIVKAGKTVIAEIQ